jgi:hypothetical protein
MKRNDNLNAFTASLAMIGGGHPSPNRRWSGRRRTEKLSDLRQDRLRIDGLLDEQNLQLDSVRFKNRHAGFHALVCQ